MHLPVAVIKWDYPCDVLFSPWQSVHGQQAAAVVVFVYSFCLHSPPKLSMTLQEKLGKMLPKSSKLPYPFPPPFGGTDSVLCEAPWKETRNIAVRELYWEHEGAVLGWRLRGYPGSIGMKSLFTGAPCLQCSHLSWSEQVTLFSQWHFWECSGNSVWGWWWQKPMLHVTSCRDNPRPGLSGRWPCFWYCWPQPGKSAEQTCGGNGGCACACAYACCSTRHSIFSIK